MLKTIIIRFFFIALAIWLTSFKNISAVPAIPNLLEITQPDGTLVKAFLKGDEYFSWWESEKGDVLFRNLDSGYFEYAKLSKINEKEDLASTGIKIVAAEEEFPSTHAKISKQDLGKIWTEKRQQARKRLQKILRIMKQTEN